MHLTFILALLCTCSLFAESLQDQVKPDYGPQKLRALESTVDYFESLFWTQYAPFRWKQMYWKWNPQAEGELIKRTFATKDLSFDENKKAFNRYLGSCRDIHVGIFYDDRRAAYIPLNVDWIDNKILVTRSNYPELESGDEIYSINSQPALDYFSQQIYGTSLHQAPLNRLCFHIKRLFMRYGFKDAIPSASDLYITVKKPDGSLRSIQTKWIYVQDIYTARAQSRKQADLEPPLTAQEDFNHLYSHYAQFISSFGLEDHPSNLSDHFQNNSPENKASWDIYQINDRNIGYLRIPNFSDEDLIYTTKEALVSMHLGSDALLIDLRDNPGGYVHKCWGVLSLLTDKPLINPIFSEILDEKIVRDYAKMASHIKTILNAGPNWYWIWNNPDYPWTTERLQGYYHFLTSAIDDWDAGLTCTRWMPLFGEAFVAPHPHFYYSKPIFVLINEKCASCADIFPAIMQDNKIATLLGNTTTGAGGHVRSFSMPNFTGIKVFSLTRSLIVRNNNQVLEDLGVRPDFEYKRSLSNALYPELELKDALDFAAKKLQDAESKK